MLEPGGSPFRSVRYADQSALRTAPRVALAAVLVLVVVGLVLEEVVLVVVVLEEGEVSATA